MLHQDIGRKMGNFKVIKEICQELSTAKWFYDSTIEDGIESYCHKNNISLSEKEKNDYAIKIKRVLNFYGEENIK